MAKPKSSKSKKTSGKKKGKMASKKQAAEPDQANTVLIQLKKLRDDYLLNSAFYLCNEPILIKRFDKAVTSLEPIDKILINNASITFNDMYSIALTMSNYEPLNFICLWSVKLDVRSLEALATLIKSHTKLSVLHLIDNNINTLQLATPLRLICQYSQALKTIVLDHNALGSRGAAQIFQGVIANLNPNGLVKLSLRYCQLDSECCDKINQMLSKTQLRDLDLCGNNFNDTGITIISDGLKTNTSLKTLSLAANQISERFSLTTTVATHASTIVASRQTFPGIQSLMDCLAKDNVGLSVLDLRGNFLPEEECARIYDMLVTRKKEIPRLSPLIVYVSERISGDLFDRILDMNDAMNDLAKGKSGKKGKKK